MNADELLSNNLRFDLPLVSGYDGRYAAADAALLESSLRQDPFALFELAERYREGVRGVEEDMGKAFDLYQKVLYSQRNLTAMYWLGALCLTELPEHRDDGFKYLNTAYSLGGLEAAVFLGMMHMDHPEFAETDYAKAQQYLLFAKEHGAVNIDGYLGRAADHQGHYDEARAYYEAALRNGQKEYANHLGFMYFAGNGVAEDKDKAKEYFHIAYDYNKSPYAALMIGTILKDGSDSEKAAAFSYLKEASSGGMKKANLLLGDLYFSGIPDRIKVDTDAALLCYQQADESDIGQAMFSSALIYAATANQAEMHRCVLRSAEEGFPPALAYVQTHDRLLLQYSLSAQTPVVTAYNSRYDSADISEVLKNAETDPVAMYELASRFRLGEQGVEADREKALQWYRKVLLHERNAKAYYWIGRMFEEDESDRERYVLRLDYYRAAYSLGSADAAVKIGIEYEFGESEGFEKDLDKALSYYVFAKEHGRAWTDSFIAHIYELKGDPAAARRYYEMGIAEEDPHAMFELGGWMMGHDEEEEGLRLMKRAADLGLEEAKSALATYKTMAAKEIVELFDEVWNHKSEEGWLAKANDIIVEGHEMFPHDPDILIRFVKLGNLSGYASVVNQHKDRAVAVFSNMLDSLRELKQTAPPRLSKEVRHEESFCCTQLAKLLLDANEDERAAGLLKAADRVMTPYSAVVSLEYHMKKHDEAAERGSRLPAEFYRQMEADAQTLRRTVESEANWNGSLERSYGYLILFYVYGSPVYKTCVRQDPAYAKKCREKAGELNPSFRA
ncbi:MAG: sel1 repeat family protein [Lachnospiraceae bacterium]|nr:sel1 repeat family protein [Lachnospiraceae bacterium]